MHALSVAHRDGIIDGPQAYWKTFDIKKAVEMIGEAWQEITPVTMNAVWRKLWPQAVHNFTGFAVPDTAALSKEIAALANEAALGDGKEVTEEDVQQLLNSHDQELTTQDLLELEETRTDAADPESPVPPLTITQLQKALELYYEANDFLLQIDPDMDRSFKVRSSVKGAIRCYEELLRSKQMEKKQQRITAYFKPALAPQPSAAAPPSSD
ncbi:tigger transposable element-derived protein 1-like [Eriocheir sinensis]|nr:tigger transposable element-derived protein 1-like [Eriocheir sinensis]